MKHIHDKAFKIAASGAAEGHDVLLAKAVAHKLGKHIAEKGIILLTGATTGAPFYVARCT